MGYLDDGGGGSGGGSGTPPTTLGVQENAIEMGGHPIEGLGDGQNPTDAATKEQVDNVSAKYLGDPATNTVTVDLAGMSDGDIMVFREGTGLVAEAPAGGGATYTGLDVHGQDDTVYENLSRLNFKGTGLAVTTNDDGVSVTVDKPSARTHQFSTIFEDSTRFTTSQTGSGSVTFPGLGMYLQTVGSPVGYAAGYLSINLVKVWERLPRMKWIVGSAAHYGDNASYSLTTGIREGGHGASRLGNSYVGFAGFNGSIKGIASIGDGSTAEFATADFTDTLGSSPELAVEFIDATTIKFTVNGESKTLTDVAMPEASYVNVVSQAILDNPGGQGYWNYAVSSFTLSWYEDLI